MVSGGLPIGPLVFTILGAASFNLVISYLLARAMLGDRILRVPELLLIALALITLLSAWCALRGWRRYLRNQGVLS